MKPLGYLSFFWLILLLFNFSTSFSQSESDTTQVKIDSTQSSPRSIQIQKVDINTNRPAQDTNIIFIQGKVLNYKDSLGIKDVEVSIKDRAISKFTNTLGMFVIGVSKKDTALIINYPGFEIQEVRIPKNGEYLKIILQAERSPADLGIKTELEENLLGSLVHIKSDALNVNNSTTFDSRLQGLAAGVHVTQYSGVPASATMIRIRGVNSVNAGSEPLYVIDGVPMISGDQGDGAGSIGVNYGNQINNLADISPEDIESINILKDVAHTSLYGARGSNGVILVTTKRGRPGRTRINVGYSKSFNTLTNKIDVMDAEDYRNTLKTAYDNTRSTNPGMAPYSAENAIKYTPKTDDKGSLSILNAGIIPRLNQTDSSIKLMNNSIANNTNNDWLSPMYRLGTQDLVTATASGGDKSVKFYLGTSYLKQKGVLADNNYDRFSFRFNADNTAIQDKLYLGLRYSMTFSNMDMPTTGYFPNGGFGVAQSTALPIYPDMIPQSQALYSLLQGNEFYNSYSGTNTKLLLSQNQYLKTRKNFRNYGEIFIKLIILKKIQFRSGIGVDYLTVQDRGYSSDLTNLVFKSIKADSGVVSAGAVASDFRKRYFSLSVSNQLTYKYSNESIGNFNFLLSNTFTKMVSKVNGATGIIFPNSYTKFASGSALPSLTDPAVGFESGFITNTYVFNTNYDKNEKYLASLTGSYNQSSRYGKNISGVALGTISIAWNAHKDNLISNIKSINILKPRLSYGMVGNSVFDNNLASGYWKGGQSYFNPTQLNYLGQYPYQMSSLNLKPEITHQVDFGIDYQILNRRISGSFNIYNKRTNNVIAAYPSIPSQGIGAPTVTQNGLSLNSQGVELTINSLNIDKKVKWMTDFNFTYNKSTVNSLDNLTSAQAPNTETVRLQEGASYGQFYMPKWAGVDPTTGAEMVYDLNGNKVTPTSQAELKSYSQNLGKSILPKVWGGIFNKISYKGFDVDILFTYSLGNYIFDSGEMQQSYHDGQNNLRSDIAQSWTNPGDQTDKPKLLYAFDQNGKVVNPFYQTPTSRFLHDGSYGRLKALTFSYTLPKRWIRSTKTNSIKVYASANNLFTITKFKGWDPEVAGNLANPLSRNLGSGVTHFDLPQVRTFTMGISVGI